MSCFRRCIAFLINSIQWSEQSLFSCHFCYELMSARSVAQLCLTLWDPKDCSRPGSSVYRIVRQEHQSGLSCPPPGDLPDPGIGPASLMSPALVGGWTSQYKSCLLKEMKRLVQTSQSGSFSGVPGIGWKQEMLHRCWERTLNLYRRKRNNRSHRWNREHQPWQQPCPPAAHFIKSPRHTHSLQLRDSGMMPVSEGQENVPNILTIKLVTAVWKEERKTWPKASRPSCFFQARKRTVFDLWKGFIWTEVSKGFGV